MNMFGKIRREIRHVRRSREIVNVLIKHGFGYLTEQLGLELPRGKKVGHEIIKIPGPVRARLVLEELGPTFIKFGQTMSMRPDLIPTEFTKEFEKLQDTVPGFAYEDAEKQIREGLGAPVKELFDSLDKEPVAAASIAQVHNAVLDGVDVVVKIRRPMIEEVIEADLDILFNLARLVTKHIPESRLYDPTGIVEEFAKTIRKELDFNLEARNAERFRRNFLDDPSIHIPEVYWEYTSKGILTMETVVGTKVSDLGGGVEEQVRKNLSENIAKAYMKQILADGFFHADPHPGNIFVMDDEVIAFVDFGIVGRVDDYMKEKLASLFIGVIQKDTRKLVDEFLDIGVVGDETVIFEFRNDIGDLIDRYYGTSLRQIEISSMMNEVMEIALKHRIRIPANFVLLIKTLVTIEGICRELDPDFNLTEISKPFVESLVAERLQPKRIIRRFIDNVSEFNELIIKLPRRLDRILFRLQESKFTVDLEHRGLGKLMSELDTVSNRISVSLIISAIIVASSVIMLTGEGHMLFGFPTLGVLGFVVAGILGMGLVISILRSGRF